MLRVVAYVPRDATLLDVGAGHGLFARLAVDHGAMTVTTIEPDLRKVFPLDGVRAVIGYDEAIRGTFGAVSIIDVLYKIPLAQWDAFLVRIAARVKPGGTLIIKEQDPTARIKSSWNRVQERLASALGLTLGESFSYEAPTDFAKRLERHGFRDVRIEKIDRWYPHPHVLYVAKQD
jgi:2-polyprenyl-3-methyl-5-hydroxy-6-metoxy-1,4-benzoquinol methylase